MLERYKELIREMGYSGKDMAVLFGMNYDSYRRATRPSGKCPSWVRVFVVACELSEGSDSEKNRVLRTEDGDVRDWSEHPRHDEMVSGMADGFKGITVEQASKALQGFGVSTTEVKKSWKDNVGS